MFAFSRSESTSNLSIYCLVFHYCIIINEKSVSTFITNRQHACKCQEAPALVTGGVLTKWPIRFKFQRTMPEVNKNQDKKDAGKMGGMFTYHQLQVERAINTPAIMR